MSVFTNLVVNVILYPQPRSVTDRYSSFIRQSNRIYCI